MGTMTAHILTGDEHPFHGGINASHSLALYENSRPAWVLTSFVTDEFTRHKKPIVWIPTVENMMEDGLLLLGLHAWKAPDLLALDSENGIKSKSQVEMYRTNPATLAKMRECNRQLIYKEAKIIVSTFEGSSIGDSEVVLTNYHLRWEWCCSGGRQAHGIEGAGV
jgi:hypothetical protein